MKRSGDEFRKQKQQSLLEFWKPSLIQHGSSKAESESKNKNKPGYRKFENDNDDDNNDDDNDRERKRRRLEESKALPQSVNSNLLLVVHNNLIKSTDSIGSGSGISGGSSSSSICGTGVPVSKKESNNLLKADREKEGAESWSAKHAPKALSDMKGETNKEAALQILDYLRRWQRSPVEEGKVSNNKKQRKGASIGLLKQEEEEEGEEEEEEEEEEGNENEFITSEIKDTYDNDHANEEYPSSTTYLSSKKHGSKWRLQIKKKRPEKTESLTKTKEKQAVYLVGGSKKAEGKKGLLVSGPPGSGKTTAVILACRQLGLDIVEIDIAEKIRSERLADRLARVTQPQVRFDASSLIAFAKTRGADSGEEKIRSVFATKRSTDEVSSAGKNGPGLGPDSESAPGCVPGTLANHCVLLDNLDNEASERGATGTIAKAIRLSQEPVICVCNDADAKRLAGLREVCECVAFQRAATEDLKQRMMEVMKRESDERQAKGKERFRIEGGAAKQILTNAQGDYRQLELALQFYFSDKQETKLGVQEVKLHAADMDQSALSAARGLLASTEQRKNVDLEGRLGDYFVDTRLLPQILFANYLDSRPDKAAVSRQKYKEEQLLSDIKEKRARNKNVHEKRKKSAAAARIRSMSTGVAENELNLRAHARAAELMSAGDVLQATVSRDAAWELAPETGLIGCVFPASLISGKWQPLRSFGNNCENKENKPDPRFCGRELGAESSQRASLQRIQRLAKKISPAGMGDGEESLQIVSLASAELASAISVAAQRKLHKKKAKESTVKDKKKLMACDEDGDKEELKTLAQAMKSLNLNRDDVDELAGARITIDKAEDGKNKILGGGWKAVPAKTKKGLLTVDL